MLSDCNPAYFCTKGILPTRILIVRRCGHAAERKQWAIDQSENTVVSVGMPGIREIETSSSVAEVETISKNLSIGGLLVGSAALIPEHTPVSFIICVRGEKIRIPFTWQEKARSHV